MQVKEATKKKNPTAICPVRTKASAPSAHPLSGSGSFQPSQSVEEDLGKEVPPFEKEENLEREKPGRRLLPEPSGSRKRAPVSSGFTTTGPSNNHLDRRVWPDYTEKGLADKEKQSVTLRNHMERERKQQKKEKRHSFHQVWAEDSVPTSFHDCWEDSCLIRWAELLYLEAGAFRVVPMFCNSIRDWWW